jgi:hypothetical protein
VFSDFNSDGKLGKDETMSKYPYRGENEAYYLLRVLTINSAHYFCAGCIFLDVKLMN